MRGARRTARARGAARAVAVLLVAGAAALGGCAASPGRAFSDSRPAGPIVPATMRYQGEAWEAVLPGPSVAAARAAPGPEHGRRDGSLNIRVAQAPTALDDWPQPARPSLAHSRYLFLPRRAETVIYFESHRDGRHHHQRWGGARYLGW